MCKIIAIANQKGGVGKTTSTLNLGVGLVRKGYRVLLIDADPQGSLTIGCGFEPDEIDMTLNEIMRNIIDNYGVEDHDGLIRHDEGFDLMPGNIKLADLEMSLAMSKSTLREYVLKGYINIVRENYDYILIDCARSLGMLVVNALTGADSVIIPMIPCKSSVDGVQQLFRTIALLRQGFNPNLKIEGILFTMYESRTNFTREFIKLVTETYKNNLNFFQTFIPSSIDVRNATAECESVIKYKSWGKVSKGYLQLADEITLENIA